MENIKKTKTTYGLCLGGGGSRGAAHIGVIKVLSKRVNITHLCGVSAGAIVATLYASGNLDKLEEYITKITMRDLNRFFKFSKTVYGLFSSKSIENFMRDMVGDTKLQELRIPTIVAASDIKHGRLVCFKRGKVAKVVAASSAVPGLFTPVKIGNMILLDGGLYNNLPAQVLKGKVDKIISVDVGVSSELFLIRDRISKTKKVVSSIKDDLELIKKEFRILKDDKNQCEEKRIVRTKKILKYVEKLKKEKDNETLRLIYKSLLRFLSQLLDRDVPKIDSEIIRVNTRINHLDFAHSKRAIKDGEKAAKKFLEEHNLN